ncbi:MAG: DNA repair protein RecO [Clostridia bacterium]|nr:DNA repair protein RecO [Clostridia bacterium]
MGQFKTNAIVIGRTDYRDHDRMLTLFSPDRGRLEVLARRAKSPKSPLLSASELFCSGEYVLYSSGEHTSVVSCQVTDAFYPLREDYERLSHGTLMLEMCRVVVQPEQPEQRFFLHFLRSLAHLAYGSASPRSVTAVFMAGLLSLNGFRPAVRKCTCCGNALIPGEGMTYGFSLTRGGILCPACCIADGRTLTGKDVADMQWIMKEGLAALDGGLKVSSAVFYALLEMAKKRLECTFQSEKMLAF